MGDSLKYNGQPRSKLLKARYNITCKQWDKMFSLQEGKCPICLKDIYKPKNKLGRKAACVDHDHKTGRVRGLTCFHCNKYKISNNTAETAERITIYLKSDFDGRTI